MFPTPATHALVEEDVAEQPGRLPWPEGARRRPPTDVSSAKQIRAEVPRPPVVEPQHGAVPLRRPPTEMCAARARAVHPRRCAALPDGPAPVHAEMAPHGDASLEAEQEVFPDRIDGLEHAAVDGTGDVRHQPAGAR